MEKTRWSYLRPSATPRKNMSDNVSVTYNGRLISPPPFVSRTMNPLDYGKRWGFEDVITLKGQYPVGSGTSGVITGFMDMFTGQFCRLEVKNTSNLLTVLDYPYVILEDVTFDSNRFHPYTYVPYVVKLRQVNVPSGVVDPSNEYSFTQNEDGTVGVSHRISAKGIVTNADYDSALQNAKNFVKNFTGAATFNPFFISTGANVLLSQSETLDRLTATYSIAESFKYNSGENLDYIYTHSLDIDQSKDQDYVTLSLSYNRQGSSITSNLASLRTGITGFNLFQFLETKYSLNTGRMYINTFNVAEESGKNNIQVSASVISGIGDEFNGFFDYDLDLKWDKIADVRQFSVNGKFLSKAPVSLKKTQLQSFKTANPSLQQYLYNIVTGSELYKHYYDTTLRAPNVIPSNFSVSENTGIADFSMNATFTDKDYLVGMSETSFTVGVDASRNLYEFKPSANIEGNYVIQDLQTVTRENVKLSCNIKTTGNISDGLVSGKAVESQLASSILSSSFLTESGFDTGIYDLDVNASYFNSGSKFGLDTRYYYSQNPKSLRSAGYSWGL